MLDAAVYRTRPVVLTALATVLAMVPLTRSVFWGPMAIAIMGGLTVATLLTIFFVPALYAAWFKVRRSAGRRHRPGAGFPGARLVTAMAQFAPEPTASSRGRREPEQRARVAMTRQLSTMLRQRARALLVCTAALLLGACSTVRPWINQPLAAASPVPSSTPMMVPVVGAQEPAPSIVAAVTLSGGGARAAAFGLGVLEELKAAQFELDGRPTTLLDEVGLISGVSGGSILAGYYAAFGDEVFTRFERDFLLVNFQSGLIRTFFCHRAPSTSSPRPGTAAATPWREQLDTVFRGKTFGDLRAQHSRRRLLVTTTDLTTGAPFEFTPEQFALICSDLDSVPLSFAIAASSSVPLLLSPMTVRNYAGSCQPPAPLDGEQQADPNLSARLLQLIAGAYRNAEERPYIHLVDGGLVDNLGVRSLLDRAVAAGSLSATFSALPPGSVRKIVLISVNSERDMTDRIDRATVCPAPRRCWTRWCSAPAPD